MAERRRIRPDYDEKITVDEPLEYEEAVERLLNTPAELDEDELVEDEGS